jgi:hypothetical protein
MIRPGQLGLGVGDDAGERGLTCPLCSRAISPRNQRQEGQGT